MIAAVSPQAGPWTHKRCSSCARWRRMPTQWAICAHCAPHMPLGPDTTQAFRLLRLSRLRAVRLHRRMSQRELAQEANLSQMCISLLERGQSHARQRTARRIAEALDTTVEELT